jgi:hypothetical protein
VSIVHVLPVLDKSTPGEPPRFQDSASAGQRLWVT